MPPLLRNISDTARWVAIYRANESDRADALFRDPFARRLAGERGQRIESTMPAARRNSWPFVVRTCVFDEFIVRSVAEGCDLVLNLAAGLDARPYRLALPPSLHWIEIDLPEILDEKEEILRNEKPACALERVRLNLTDVSARRTVFDELGRRAKRVLVVSEGLIVYLSADEVGALAEDLARPPSFQRWALDLASPGLLKMLQRSVGAQLDAAGAPLKFAPADGPDFFSSHGWRAVEVRSMFKTAARLRRLPLLLHLMSFLPESNGPQGSRPWSGGCLLQKAGS